LVPIGKNNAPDRLMPASRYELGSPNQENGFIGLVVADPGTKQLHGIES
jgi:hypothetical protein